MTDHHNVAARDFYALQDEAATYGIRCRECGHVSIDNGSGSVYPREHEHPEFGRRCRGCDRGGERVVVACNTEHANG